jgi:hypothetical protein
MNFVETHIAGDTLDFQVAVPDYPSNAGWTLKYRLTARFASPAQAPIGITASANTDGTYQIQASPATTGQWAAGSYTWSRWVEKTGARQTLNERGQLEIRPDPSASAQGLDTRTHARKVLEAVEACLENRASTTQREMVEYTIGSRGQKFDAADTRASLVQLRSTYLWLVADEDAREKIAAGLPNPRNVGIRFGRP